MSSNPKRTHRKRLSALRLSIDTSSTLPEYLPTGRDPILHLDEPPDYPDSAEEADEDTDQDVNFVEVPQPLSPKRTKRLLPSHKRRHSSQHQYSLDSTDPHLDSLLERSVHALEMSNTLLQSSISTQTSLSAVLALDSPGDLTLETRARNLSSRIRNNWDVQASWVDDLEEISKNVEGLFREDASNSRRNSVRPAQAEGSISCSLPSSSLPTMRKNLRRPSLDLHQASTDHTTISPRLHYSSQSRSHLIAPPPRALTQYVASTQDSESILLPSTLGLRSSPSVHHASDWKTLSECASSSTTSLLSTPSLPPKLTDKPLEPSTPAYTMLSSFVYRAPSSGSSTPSTSFTSSFISRRRNSGNSTASAERGHSRTPRRLSSSPASHRSSDKLHHQDHCGSCSACLSAVPGCLLTDTPKRGVSPMTLHRPMTPPVEESSSSSDDCVAKRTVQSLRKILDDQATLQSNGHANGASSSRSSSTSRARLHAPPFLPRTPVPAAETGTSTATASISRLFTKNTHSSSTRPPSPPRQSAMKRSPVPSTPSSSVPPTPTATNSNSVLHMPLALFPDMVVKALGSSTPSSGMSTPSKRISFAELPESYSSTRPGGSSSSKFKDKHRRKRKNGSSKGRGKEQSSSDGNGWWNGWLTTGGLNVHGLSLSLARQEERMEARNWGGGRMGTGFSNNLDDWAI
ncbi:hypothetical protein BYT27DRAFT_6646339 [Phlegmacium glaucopus]|nr:hypothetical protein BYT27DRAFT_6646339 [Phlegmacium glaucopus]